MTEEFQRTEILFGEENMAILANARVAVFGIGGVGSFVTESLARAGVGTLDLIDFDTVSISNLNRQLLALYDTVGRKKVEVMKERISQINKRATVNIYDCYYGKENENDFDFSQYDYVVDAIDVVTSKLLLIKKCQEVGTPIISSMGTGNKVEPEQLTFSDIYKTSVCPLAKVMRKECKNLGIKKLKVLYSKELPKKPNLTEAMLEEAKESGRRSIPGSTSFVPATAGLMIGSAVIRELIGMKVKF